MTAMYMPMDAMRGIVLLCLLIALLTLLVNLFQALHMHVCRENRRGIASTE